MIIFVYLIRELLKSSIAILAVLLLIFLSNQFVRLLAGAASGKYPADIVWGMLGLTVPSLAGLLMPLSFFLAILFCYGRFHAEHELTVLTACGLSLKQLLRYTFYPACVFALICATLYLWLAPWGFEQSYQLEQKASENVTQQPFETGKFHSLSNGEKIIFIEDSQEQRHIGRVFLVQQAQGDQAREILIAQSGSIVSDAQSGSDYLLLDQGMRFVASPGQSRMQIVDYKQYGMRVKERQAAPKKRKIKALPTLSLIGESGVLYQGELQWRLSMPLSLLILAWIAVPLSHVKPRQGKFAKFLPGICLYFSYFILLTVARNLLEDEKIPVFVGLWWVHGLFALLAIFLTQKQSSSFRRHRRRLQGASA